MKDGSNIHQVKIQLHADLKSQTDGETDTLQGYDVRTGGSVTCSMSSNGRLKIRFCVPYFQECAFQIYLEDADVGNGLLF